MDYTLGIDDVDLTATNGKLPFRGYYGSSIEYDANLGHWRLKGRASTTTAVHNATSEYPLGKKLWYFHNEADCNIDKDEDREKNDHRHIHHHQVGVRYLKLSTCRREDEFTCDDGTCINMIGRCDHKRDCPDYSDESNCGLVSIDSRRYISDFAPGQVEGYGMTKVDFKVEILALDDIRELDMTINVQFRLTLSWLDPRLEFSNLKVRRSFVVCPSSCILLTHCTM